MANGTIEIRPAIRTFLFILVILSVGIIIYLPALPASFHLDDGPSIRDNPVIRHLNLAEIWDFWPTRFLTYLSLAINFHYSALHPYYYHLVNVIIHLFNALIVYLLLRRLCGDRGAAPLIGALIFVAHPVQTQAATYVIQRATSIAAGFYLLSLLFYLKCFQLKKKNVLSDNNLSPDRRGLPIFSYIFSLLFCCGAMLSKEFSISLPLALVLLEFFLPLSAKNKPKRIILRLLPFLFLLLLIPALTRIYSDNPHYNDSGQIEWLKNAGVLTHTAPGHGESPRDYLVTQSRVFVTYLRLLFLPLSQQLDYDYPKFTSPFNLQVLLSIMALAAIVISILLCRRKSLPAAALGMALFILILLPESSFIPILDLIAEHRLYLPLFGAVLAFSVFLSRLSHRKTALTAGILLVLLFAGLSYHRNFFWRDPVTLWEDNVKKSPGKARIRGNLGKAYLDQGRYRKAAEEFKKLIEIDPTFASAYNNLAVIYINNIKDYAQAEKYIDKSLAIYPDYPAGYVNRGVIRLNSRRINSAITNFEKALELDPRNLLAHFNLGACYINLGDLYIRDAETMRNLGKEKEADEKDEAARLQYLKAEEALRTGLQYWPKDFRFYGLLSRVYRSLGEPEKAAAYREKAETLKNQSGDSGSSLSR